MYIRTRDIFVLNQFHFTIIHFYHFPWVYLHHLIIINPITARVIATSQMICKQFFRSSFPSSAMPSGTGHTLLACPFPDVVFPPSHLSTFVHLHFHPLITVSCKIVLAISEDCETWPNHCSLFLFMIDNEIFVRFNCLLGLGTDFLINSLVFIWNVKYLVIAPNFNGLFYSLECYIQYKPYI